VIFSLLCFDTVGWVTGMVSNLQNAGCWFVDGDEVTGALRDLQIQLPPPLPSSLAAIKPANPGSPGKMAVKMERVRSLLCQWSKCATSSQLVNKKKTDGRQGTSSGIGSGGGGSRITSLSLSVSTAIFQVNLG